VTDFTFPNCVILDAERHGIVAVCVRQVEAGVYGVEKPVPLAPALCPGWLFDSHLKCCRFHIYALLLLY
jgi:hypothetical protein